MKILILSDIHGNLPALEKVLKRESSVDLIISLGDVVNYGPWSNECVQLIDCQSKLVAILGNHDEAFINGVYTGENQVVVAFFNHCIQEFTEQIKLKEYRLYHKQDECMFIHTISGRYLFEDSTIDLEQDTFVGHSHRMFSVQRGDYLLSNPGSVGQNRTNINIINYALWFPESRRVELMQFEHDSNLLFNEMKRKNYPKICFDYLTKRRP